MRPPAASHLELLPGGGVLQRDGPHHLVVRQRGGRPAALAPRHRHVGGGPDARRPHHVGQRRHQRLVLLRRGGLQVEGARLRHGSTRQPWLQAGQLDAVCATRRPSPHAPAPPHTRPSLVSPPPLTTERTGCLRLASTRACTLASTPHGPPSACTSPYCSPRVVLKKKPCGRAPGGQRRHSDALALL